MIKFLDLQKLNSRYEKEFKLVFHDFLNSGNYILGEKVSSFEKEFADYCSTNHCIGVSNGLDALKLIFESYKILGLLEKDDEVIVPANTYIATVLAISNSGLKPILVEPELSSYNIDPNKIVNKLSSKTKAILGVHLYGKLYDVMQLEELSKEYNLLLIEDAAQAHGAVFHDGRKAGNLSHAAAFSFYPTKNLGALGDAGAITTNDSDLAEILCRLRNYGRTSTYKNEFKGYNCRLDEIQAALLRVKLRHLDSDNSKRREIAKFYLDNINTDSITLPDGGNWTEHVFHQFVIRSKTRDNIKTFLLEHGVETSIHYPIPIHRQVAYSELSKSSFPITEKLNQEVLSLPIHPLLTNSEIYEIMNILNDF